MNPFYFHSFFLGQIKSSLLFSTNVNIHFYTFSVCFEDAKSRRGKKQVEATTKTDQNIEQIEMTFTNILEFSTFGNDFLQTEFKTNSNFEKKKFLLGINDYQKFSFDVRLK